MPSRWARPTICSSPSILTGCAKRSIAPGLGRQARRVADTVNAERAAPSKIVARKGQDYYLLDLGEVFAFQADGELVWALTANERYLAADTLKTLEGKLAASAFRRVHRGALVNTEKIRKVTSISSQRWLLTLTNGAQLTVSKRQASAIREILS